ncbi:MAG: glutathione S-transferase N-terminal domain-containing protein [Pseudomonadota bacterium]
MSTQEPIELVGATPSPYTQKMLALLRYRRIPYAVSWGHPDLESSARGVAPPRPAFMPTFFLEGEEKLQAICDSTPIIRELERRYTGRSVIPTDPALAFIDYLLEDFGDEWCTKYMYHYRWSPKEDADNASTLLPLAFDVTLSSDQLEQSKREFVQRQVARLHVVGSNRKTTQVIEDSYRRFLKALNSHLSNQGFLLGNRPASGDFALYGQLTQLIGFDPTPRKIAYELSPRTVAWITQVADLSGLNPEQKHDWLRLEDQAESLKELLSEVGRAFAPAQVANARAVAAGKSEWKCSIDGVQWSQPTFKYQAKCLQWTIDKYTGLESSDRARVDQFLKNTGVEQMLRFAH